MPGIVGIRFRDNGQVYRVSPGDFSLQVGERVIVETKQGREMGTVVRTRRPLTERENEADFPQVIRIADEDDLAQYEINNREEQEAFNICRDLIDEHGLEMFLVAAEYTYDERKLLFYFTAEGRVDFRELVRDLASRFHVRIELRQIGVRDDAKMNGGMGICGRELCCSSWMNSFSPVSIRMAKEQNISMNPSKVSGNCGRLLCCLNYENDNYKANRKLLPKQGSMIDLPDGGKAKVMQCDILGLRLTLMPQLSDGSWGTCVTVPAEEVGWGELRRKNEGNKNKGDCPASRAQSEDCKICRKNKQQYDLQNNVERASADPPAEEDKGKGASKDKSDKDSSRSRKKARDRSPRSMKGGKKNRGREKLEAKPRESKLRNSRRSKPSGAAEAKEQRRPRYIINPKPRSRDRDKNKEKNRNTGKAADEDNKDNKKE